MPSLAKRMLDHYYCPSEESQRAILKEILSIPRYYVAAERGTGRIAWEQKRFAAYVDAEKRMVLFLSADEVIRFAERNGLTMDGQPMIMKAAQKTISELMMEYYESGLITGVKVFSIPPMSLSCSVQAFLDAARNGGEEAESKTADTGELPYLEVERIKKVLDTYDNTERRKLDPAGRFENAHQVMETLLMRNSIDPAVLDRKYDFSPGFTKNFCANIADSSVSKEALSKLLSYFGLAEYLYLYKGNCRELMAELQDNTAVDVYALRPVRASTKEPFTLAKVQRGTDENNSAYVYGLTLQSKHRKLRIVVSNPFGCIEGKSYEVVGLEPLVEVNNPMGVTKAHEVMRDDTTTGGSRQKSEEDRIIRPTKPGRQFKGPPEELKARQDFILGHFRKTDGINYQEAVAKYKVLVEDPDVLEAYYKYLREGKHGWLVRNSVTPEMLVKEYRYPPYEAYCIMAKLLDDPTGTVTMLKHRKNEPQFRSRTPENDPK